MICEKCGYEEEIIAKLCHMYINDTDTLLKYIEWLEYHVTKDPSDKLFGLTKKELMEKYDNENL